MSGPLSGYRVIDLTTVVMGPIATMTLGDMGADVIVVEQADGDLNRSMGSGPTPEFSGVSLNLMRNKRSVTLDLKTQVGLEHFKRLLRTADVLITTMRPGALKRLGLDYESLDVDYPDLVYCQAQGFPRDSPRADDPAYDDIIQAAGGLVDCSSRADGEARYVPSIVADKVCGLVIVQSVLAALLHRERTGEGQHIEVPMVDATRAFVLVEHGNGAISEPATGPAGYQRLLSRARRPQRTADGWICILPYAAEHYDLLFSEGGRPEVVGDPRYATAAGRIEHSGFLYEAVHELTATRPTAAWRDFCLANQIPVAEIATLEELIAELPLADHPVAGKYRVVPPAPRFSRTPMGIERAAPRPGEHTVEVLEGLGFGRVCS